MINFFKRIAGNITMKIYSWYTFFFSCFLLLFSGMLKKANKKTTFYFINLTNKFYFLHFILKKSYLKSHVDFDSYINYDSNIFLYEKYLGKHFYKNKNILDVGCFIGTKLKVLSDNGANQCVGLDLSKRGINFAIKRFSDNNLKFYNCSSAEFASNRKNKSRFDYVLSYTVFEHIDKKDLLGVLNDAYDLLKTNGYFVVVYNFYFDQYGSHLWPYISHPWPQLLFREEYILEFADIKLREYHKKGEMNYFSLGYLYSLNLHNADSYQALNKLNHDSFESLLKKSRFKSFEKHNFSQTGIMRLFNFLFPSKELFKGSTIYILKKS